MFTLPIKIGAVRIEHAMCDLGASINVLPYSVYTRLVGAKLVETNVVIQLADRSCINPVGVLENIIVKVHDFLYPADFHVIQMSEASSAKSSGECLEEEFLKEKFEGVIENEEVEMEVTSWCEAVQEKNLTDEEISEAIMDFCQAKRSAGSSRPAQLASMEKAPEQGNQPNDEKENPLPKVESLPKELKKLSPGLKYAYLGEDETLPVIVNSQLTQEQEARLLEVLGRNKKAIGWTLSDLVGISPDLCMHHIWLEEGAKAHREPQRKLNPHMREEVMKEILKLLSLGIIYSIPDSEWIYVDPEDKRKTTFTCPFGTYAYWRMPFGLCNAPGTFQRCMMSIFSDLLEDCIEIFMDDFTV
ncbi:hypothetical protein AAHA92_29246 [Salvia divinorum]|uniref:Reverse transcriptase domain-containing protein n=1 Tax=Salvia divinorum TaxID=28513 RepID=A0ABD1FXR2_SALDI